MKIRFFLPVIIACFVLCYAQTAVAGEQSRTWSEYLYKNFNLFRSIALFHVSRLYNRYWYGNAFTHHRIAGDMISESELGKFLIEFDASGNITKIQDSKQSSPIILSSIPTSQDDITALKKAYCPNNPAVQIDIYTLNRDFEINWAGLNLLLQQNPAIRQRRYPTIDYSAPSLINIMRYVDHMITRDENSIAVTHCKAGRGRSACVKAAYLLTQAHEARYTVKVSIDENDSAEVVSIDKIENYMKTKRPQVSFNRGHKAGLAQFVNELKKAKSFKTHLENYEKIITAREKIYGAWARPDLVKKLQ